MELLVSSRGKERYLLDMHTSSNGIYIAETFTERVADEKIAKTETIVHHLRLVTCRSKSFAIEKKDLFIP